MTEYKVVGPHSSMKFYLPTSPPVPSNMWKIGDVLKNQGFCISREHCGTEHIWLICANSPVPIYRGMKDIDE